eukprot:1841996-Rhodomonas_salina.5
MVLSLRVLYGTDVAYGPASVGEEGIERIATALAKCPLLSVLDLGHNNLVPTDPPSLPPSRYCSRLDQSCAAHITIAGLVLRSCMVLPRVGLVLRSRRMLQRFVLALRSRMVVPGR